MTIHQLDAMFPWISFAYGTLVTLALNWPGLLDKAGQRLPGPLVNQLKSHRILGLICLVVGALWVLQNLWLL